MKRPHEARHTEVSTPDRPRRARRILPLLILGLLASGASVPASGQADLVITLNPVPKTGDLVQFRETTLGVRVRNRGNRATPDGECVKFSFSATQSSIQFLQGEGFVGSACSDRLDSGGGANGICNLGLNSVAGWCKLSSIPAGGEGRMTIRIKPLVRGGHALIMRVDPDNRIRESNDRNNVLAIPIVIVGSYDRDR